MSTIFTKRFRSALFLVFFLPYSVRAAQFVPSPEVEAVQNVMFQSTNDALGSLSVLMIMTGVEYVRQRLHQLNLGRQPIRHRDLVSAAWEGAGAIASQPLFWAQTMGHMLSEMLAGEPLARAISTVGQALNANVIFTRSLRNSIVAVITFGGWEAGGELWREARERLANTQDKDRAENIKSLLDVSNDGNRFVLTKVLANMATILFWDARARRHLSYNLWRRRITNGAFLLPLLGTTISTATTIAIVGPDAGLLSFLFGMAGGVLPTLIPENVGNSLTDAVTLGRRWLLTRSYDQLNAEILSFALKHEKVTTQDISQLQKLFKKGLMYRNFLVSIEFEGLKRNFDKLQSLLQDKRDSVRYMNFDYLSQFPNAARTTQYAIREGLHYITQKLYTDQIRSLEEVEGLVKSTVMRQMLQGQIARLQIAEEAVITMFSRLQPAMINDRLQKLDPDLLAAIDEDGFDEDQVIDEFGPKSQAEVISARTGDLARP